MIKREISKKDKTVKVTFALPLNGGESVAVLGDFNQWDPKKGKLVKRANGTVSATVALEPGKSYRFRYLREDGAWLNDDEADAFEPNQFGSLDCIINC